MRIGTRQVARDIQHEVTAQLGLTLGLKCIHPWQVTAWILRQRLSNYSDYHIGRFVGDRAGSSVRPAIAAVDALMTRDGSVAAQILALLCRVAPPLDATASTIEDRAQRKLWNNNRDVNALRVMERARQASLPPRKQPADRLCLECGKPFASQWCGNRRCKLCAERNP